MHQVIVSVGSNIDPEYNIERAIALIADEQFLTGQSTMIQTKPVGLVDQPDFINGALLIETTLSYDDFNLYLKSVEARLERDKEQKGFVPRTIDLDIVVWDGKIVHDDYHQYDHTKIPVSELARKFQIAIADDG
jgi:2-amino-4-hydroxy-6-hydroxymethyldihydropteridine diphosphokinase